VVGRAISMMGLSSALAGILLGSGPGEAFGSHVPTTINNHRTELDIETG
jgi:hypothetical protein